MDEEVKGQARYGHRECVGEGHREGRVVQRRENNNETTGGTRVRSEMGNRRELHLWVG